MTALPRLAIPSALLLAAPAAFAHEIAASGGSAGMLLLLGAAAMMLGLRRPKSTANPSRWKKSRAARDGA